MNYYGQHLSYTFADETLEHASKMLKVFDAGANDKLVIICQTLVSIS